jgi:hypothetical protein
MLSACRLAGLSALKTHDADVSGRAQSGAGRRPGRPTALLGLTVQLDRPARLMWPKAYTLTNRSRFG